MMRFSVVRLVLIFLLLAGLLFSACLPCSVLASDEALSFPFFACVPANLTSGTTVSFLNNWAPVKGVFSPAETTHFSYTDTLCYYSGSKFTAVNSAGGSFRSSNGRFELFETSEGVAVGAMYTATTSGLIDISFAALTGARELTTGASSQATKTVKGVVYYEYYSSADPDARYYAKVGGNYSAQPEGGWFIYDATRDRMRSASNVSASLSIAYPSAAFSYDIAITRNGKIIWPTTSTPWHYTGRMVDHTTRRASEDMLEALLAFEALPTMLYVEKGDRLAFVATCGDSSNCYLKMEPVVTYTTALEAVSVQAGITVDEKFAVNFYLYADDRASDVGVLLGEDYYPGTQLNDGSYCVTIGGIVAKELGDEITVTPVQVVDHIRMESAPIQVSPAQLLMQYVTEDENDVTSNLAIAILNYGAAAQVYFSYNVQNPVNAGLTEHQCAVSFDSTYYSVLGATGAAGATVLPEAISLLLEDAVAYQLYVAAAEKGAYCAQISTDPLFSAVDTVAMTAVSGSPCDYRAVFYGITPVMWNTPVYFRVLNADGDIVSPVVTYSVTSYIVRMLEKESSSGDEQDSTPVLHAMLALYEAAVAYQQI